MTEAALGLEELTRSYGGVTAVDAVSLRVQCGEFLTLLGPSGSGKSTTLKMIAGFDYPDSGVVRLGGRDVTRSPPNARDIGMVFQNYALFPHMTVFENVAFALKMRGRSRRDTRAAVDRMLETLQLCDLETRYPRQLSGGQQQRVALARALVFEPHLLLMDEPLGALDRQLRRQVQMQIKRVHQSLGVTIVFVTHDQEEAMGLSDRVAVMERGRIVQIGTPRELYASPASRFVAGFVGESNILAGTLVSADRTASAVRFIDGTLSAGRAGGTESLARGQAVECLLRPENIDLVEGADDSRHSLDAIVELSSFLGAVLELTCKTAVGELKVRTTPRPGTPSCVPGQRVRLAWSAQDLQVFARDEPCA